MEKTIKERLIEYIFGAIDGDFDEDVEMQDIKAGLFIGPASGGDWCDIGVIVSTKDGNGYYDEMESYTLNDYTDSGFSDILRDGMAVVESMADDIMSQFGIRERK